MRGKDYNKKTSGGFTLLEILIVVFIIGLTASVVAISLGENKSDSPAYKEAQAFMVAAGFVGEYADLNGEVIALFVHPKHDDEAGVEQWCYTWKRMRDNEWGELPDDTVPEHCVAPEVQWDLLIEGKPFVYDPDLERQPPVIIFASSGETTPAEMAFMERGISQKAQQIEIDLMGGVRWKNKEEEAKDER